MTDGLWFLLFLVWSVLCVWEGYKGGYKEGYRKGKQNEQLSNLTRSIGDTTIL